MRKFADFIVNHRKAISVLFVVLIVYCIWGMSQVEVEYDITTYLSEETDTRKALDIMDEEFTTYGTATIMLRNVTFDEAEALHTTISELEGVKSFSFSNTADYYKDSCALFNITFEGDSDDEASVAAYNRTVELLGDYEIFISSPLVDNFASKLASEIGIVMVIVVAIIIIVLLFTSQSFADVLVFIVTFAVAAIINMGTNFWLGTISFISNTVCVILQLALAIDYAIILSHRFAEEKKLCGDTVEALKIALSKAIVEISSSSLTTIAGLLALATMSLRLGADLGFVLAKSIICSMISVFFFMPTVMLMFSKLIDKTTHKSLVPKISFVGKFGVKMRYAITSVFLVAVIVCAYFSFGVNYCYFESTIDTDRPSDTQIAKAEIEEVFGYSNQFVIVMPGSDFDEQKQLIDMVTAHEQVTGATGLSSTSISLNGESYYLTEKINYIQFSKLLAADASLGDTVYSAYAVLSDGAQGSAIYQANKELYTISLLDLMDCVTEHDDFIAAYLYNDESSLDFYESLRDTIQDAKKQLLGENYSRILFSIDCPTESQETFNLIEELLVEVKAEYPDAIFAGNSMSAYDLNQSFSTDNMMVNLLTILFVFLILMLTFKSWGIPIPLTLTIQGAIFINFSYYTLTETNLFFFVYLIVTAIQMGATIDYAIVLTNRFNDLKKTMDKKSAVVQAVNDAFPTIMTSGLIMVSAGFLIGELISYPLIATLGTCLGRGVLISILSVLLVLPALLYIFDKPLSKTVFKSSGKKFRLPIKRKEKIEKEDQAV